MRLNHPLVIAAAVVAGIALIVLAVVYWAEPADSLPAWVPGTRPARGTITSSTASPPFCSASPCSSSRGSRPVRAGRQAASRPDPRSPPPDSATTQSGCAPNEPTSDRLKRAAPRVYCGQMPVSPQQVSVVGEPEIHCLFCPPLAEHSPDPLSAEAGNLGDQSRRLAGVVGSPDRGDQLLARLPELTLSMLDLRGRVRDRR
jgi:hypothetical protein